MLQNKTLTHDNPVADHLKRLPSVRSLFGGSGVGRRATGRPRRCLGGVARGTAVAIGAGLVFAAAHLNGCASGGGPGGDGVAVAGEAPSGPGSGWTVALDTFRGEQAEAQAERKAELIRRVGGFDGVFAERRGAAVVVGIGRFRTVDGPDARAELARVQRTVVDGVNPFAFAFMFPPMETPTGPSAAAGGPGARPLGQEPPGGIGAGGVAGGVASGAASGVGGAQPGWDLRNARATLGDGAKYTLQIGVYGAADFRADPTPEELATARREAERAVAMLRQSGELAWFFHGPKRSMVTVGIFDESVLTRDATPEYLLLKQKYPNNLYNGQGIREKLGRSEARMQDSLLVKVP